MLNKSVLTVVMSCLLAACSTSPTGRTQFTAMSDSQMNQMGIQAFSNLKRTTPISHNKRYKKFVTCIAGNITRQVGGKWEVVVFEDETLNAFALPGNKIGVHSGLVKMVDNQDQLAAVIGHEIGHVLARHSNERASQETAVQMGLGVAQAVVAPQTASGQLGMAALGLGAQYGILLPYSRTHESEADEIGLDLMARAGFDPRQSITLWQKMSRLSGGNPPEFLSTHPSDSTRIQDLNSKMAQAMPKYQRAQASGLHPNCIK